MTIAAVLVAVVLLAMPEGALTRGFEGPPPEQARDEATAVVSGQVVDIGVLGDTEEYEVRLVVERVWKGVASSGVTVRTFIDLMPLAIRVILARRLYDLSLIVLFANFISVGVLPGQLALYVFAMVMSIAGAGVSVSESILLVDSQPKARAGVMSLLSVNVEAGTAIGAALVGMLLILFGNYAAVYRLVGLLLPLGLVAITMSARHSRVDPKEPASLELEPSTQPAGQG